MNNPLQKYFRQPAIYIRLPSNGAFYPPNSIDIPANQELPVYPMTAMDEITARTPDALFNGSSIVTIVHSCVPNIRDPWAIPSIDLNSILTAIRLASYGNDMDIETTCPSCSSTNTMSIDLRQVLASIEIPDFKKNLTIGDLTFSFGPLSYKQQTDTALNQFESQKIIEVVTQSDLSEEEKITQLGQAFRKISVITLETIANTIKSIRTPDALVTDFNLIKEFLENCPKAAWTEIRDYSVSLREKSEIKPFAIECPDCKNKYEQPFTLNMSNFFDIAS